MYVIGFDYGSKRIGIAVGQTFTATAQPLTVLSTQTYQSGWTVLDDIIRAWQPQALVVGLPKQADDSESVLSHAVCHFAQRLQEHYRLPVHFIDERLSSHAALQEHSNRKKSQRIRQLDALAARIILETWLVEQIQYSSSTFQ